MANQVTGIRRLVVLVLIALAVPAVPFLVAGPAIENRLQAWLEAHQNHGAIAAGVVAILAIDVLLPVPSSLVSTLAGDRLGILLATAATWFGMSIGAIVAFALARRFGRPWAARLGNAADIDRASLLGDRFGAALIVLARGVPLLAEASVLALGLAQMPWRKFLPALFLSNLGIALVYAAFGHFARQRGTTGVALAASIALPAAAALVARAWVRRTAPTNSATPARDSSFDGN